MARGPTAEKKHRTVMICYLVHVLIFQEEDVRVHTMFPKFLNVFKPGTISHYRRQRDKEQELSEVNRMKGVTPVTNIRTLVIHEAPAELLEGSSVAHGPERAVELVVGHHQVLRVTSHVDHLENSHNCTHYSYSRSIISAPCNAAVNFGY